MKAKIIYWGTHSIHLEDSRGEFRIICKTLKSSSKRFDYESWDNFYTVSIRVIGRRLSSRFICEMFAEAYSGTNCRHTYDCCGCLLWSTYSWNVIHTKRKEYRIRQHVSRNF